MGRPKGETVTREGWGGAVGVSHLFLRRVVLKGDTVVDATCGNGHDTLFLARLVGNEGRVWSFDVQPEAIGAAADLLREAHCLSWVNLVNRGHEYLLEYVSGPVRAVVFNLGYLPGRREDVVTRPDTTLAALKQAAGLLLPGGIITLAVYTGHPGGEEEAAIVENWTAGLPARTFNSWKCLQLNRSGSAPYLVLVEKLR
jgi:SAM-dependent methyltransferase